MYLGFYGLEKEPFHITPDPEFLFLSPSHKEAFAAIVYGIEQRKGFVALTGEVGTGKTTVLRAYLKRIENTDVRPIYLFNPDLSFEQLLSTILRTLGMESEADRSAPRMLESLQRRLIQEYREKHNIALLIDEAQNMPVETLEKLRMLSNLETTSDKLLQIVLIGQPELEKKLGLHALRQLNQRIAVRTKVRALHFKESEAYIQHRLSLAGCLRPDVFTPGAVRKIAQRAKGNPRVLNILCDNCLITGFGYQTETITPRIVMEVERDVLGRKCNPLWRWATVAACMVILAAGAGILVNYMQLLPNTPAPIQAAVSDKTPSAPADAVKSSTAARICKKLLWI